MESPSDDPGHAAAVSGLFHPTYLTSDRGRLARWLQDVFGVPSMLQREFRPDSRRPIGGDYPADYVLFSWIADLWWYAADTSQWNLAGAERPAAPADRLSEWAWKIRDAETLISRFHDQGARLFDLNGRAVDTLAKMAHPISPDTHFMWSDPTQTGLSFQLVDWPSGRPGYAAGWLYPPPGPDDPLGLIPPTPPRSGLGLTSSALHTIVTEDLPRARWVIIDLLGGSEAAAVPAASTGLSPAQPPSLGFRLGGASIEYVTPDSVAGSVSPPTASLFGRPQTDVYESITLGVRDLENTSKHLRQVNIEHRFIEGGKVLETSPDDSLGMRWRFIQDN